MIERNITLPEMILWTGTRVPLGAGIGILIARRLSKDAMKAARLVLTVVGGFTTISIMGKKNLTRPEIRSVAWPRTLVSRIHGRQPITHDHACYASAVFRFSIASSISAVFL